MELTVDRIVESCIYAADLDAAERFYVEILGLTLFRKQPGRHLFFRCGASMLLIFNPETTIKDRDTPHGAHGPAHIAFAATNDDLISWKQHLLNHAVAIEFETEWPNGGKSIYFRDPAGNSLEFVSPQSWGL